jgi:hypothetical protein
MVRRDYKPSTHTLTYSFTELPSGFHHQEGGLEPVLDGCFVSRLSQYPNGLAIPLVIH